MLNWIQTEKFSGGKKMITTIASIMLTCPQCNGKFEFDAVGEYEFVPCPICGTNCVTVKKGNKLILECFEQNQMPKEPAIMV